MALTIDGTVLTGEESVTSGTSNSISLGTTVDPDRTLVIAYTHTTATGDRPNKYLARVYLSESNPGTSGYDQLTWERDATGPDVWIRWHVVEFTSGKADVYSGNADATDDLSGSVATVDTGATSLSNAVPFLSHKTDITSTFQQEHAPDVEISGTDLVLTFGAAPASGEYVYHWQVIDFAEEATVSSGQQTLTGNTTSQDDTSPSFTDAADVVLLIHSARTANALARPDTRGPFWGAVINTTKITVYREAAGGSGGESRARWYAIEFTGSQIVEAGSVALSDTTTSNDATLSSITDEELTVPWRVGAWGQREVEADTQNPSTYHYTGYVWDDTGTLKYKAKRGGGNAGESLTPRFWLTQIDQAGAAGLGIPLVMHHRRQMAGAH